MHYNKLICAALFTAAAAAFAETPKDFRGSKLTASADDAVEFKGTGLVVTQKIFAVDPAKQYTLSGEFRAPNGVSNRIFFGLQPLGSRRQAITPQAVMAIKGSETTLAADCKTGEKSILIEPNAKWKAHANNLAAFDVKADLSDLPSTAITDKGILSVEPENGKLRVNFRCPLRHNRPAGTAVRMHQDGPTYLYTGGRDLKLTSQWKNFSGKITGTSDCAMKEHLFPVGTRFVRIMIYSTGRSDSDLIQFRNLQFTETR